MALLHPDPSRSASTSTNPTPGTVYLVVGSDTAIWDGLVLTQQHCHFLPDLYTNPARNAFKVMDPAFRARFKDSFGNSLRMTWWMLVGSLHLDSDNIDVPVPNLMPLHLMQRYQGAAMKSLGDEVSLHYHTFLWSDYNHDGVSYWNEALTFHECRYDFDSTVAQCLIEEDVFPVSFRSGWHYMDNEWQARLDQLLPFSMHNDSPHVGLDLKEPFENNLDWSKASTNFVPFHPSSANYQLAGDGPGWNVRSVKMPSLTQAMMNQLFAAAAEGADQVACFWAHLPEVPFLTDIAKVDLLAHVASTNYPNVSFRYCTAVEAMQRWMKSDVRTTPKLSVETSESDGVMTLTIATDRAIFQPQPFVAVKDVWEQYQIVDCLPAGVNRWTAVLPVPRSRLAKVSLAVTDSVGNLAKKHLDFVPEDQFVDDRSAGGVSFSGPWGVATNNLSWDGAFHWVTIAPGATARALYTVPITSAEDRSYTFWTQVPVVEGVLAKVLYQLRVDGVVAASYRPESDLPSRQWVPLFSATLRAGQSNVVECLFQGDPVTPSFGRADVLRVTPLLSGPPFITDLQVEADETSALVTWTTPVPASTKVEFGSDAVFDRAIEPAVPLMRRHVATLDGLIPGTPYFFKVTSVAEGRTATLSQTFFTLKTLRPGLVVSLTNEWRFTTNNLDGKRWTLPSYDDEAWSTGSGVFWADNRTSPNPAIPALGSALPLDPSTGFPFVTYYFRTRFDAGEKIPGMSLAFSNYLDDGAVFYLNGTAIQRRHLPASPTVITNGTRANGFDCTGDATCSTLFSLSPSDTASTLLSGTNLLAVEVHNYSAKSPDISFGTAVFLNALEEEGLTLRSRVSEGVALLYWNGPPATVEEAENLMDAVAWKPLMVKAASPVPISNSGTRFYRLRLE